MMNCAYCKREMKPRSTLTLGRLTGLERTRDHYIPLSRGGTNAKENIRPSCYRCNNIKGNMMPDEWAAFMAANPCWWAMQVNTKKQTSLPLAKLAPVSHLRSMTAEENARRIKAYLESQPQYRPLRKDEPFPIEYDDPMKQAAFEAAYTRWGRWLLRVPVDGAAP
jgi:hypothetical protein